MNNSVKFITGQLIKRYKRFFADVKLDTGEIVTAHCPNTGSMMGLLDKGNIVFLSKTDNAKRKLKYTLEIIKVLDANIGVNTHRANRIVENAIVELKKNGTTDITLLHCTTEYPCPIKEVNLLKIKTLQKAFNLPVGFSDHTEGISSALASVSLGVTVIEKHFTLDKKMTGPDHIASINPIELNTLVTGIREVEKAIGSPLFVPTRAELLNINTMRRKIVASEDIKIGETFTLKNVGFKRSKGGLTPDFCDLILGKKASINYTKDDVIQL